MTASKRSISLIVAALASLVTLSARASSVTIDTGIANWQYVGTTTVYAGNDPALAGAATVLAPPNPGWLSALTLNNAAITVGAEASPNAQWIGNRANGGTFGYYGDFVFSLTLSYADFVPSPGFPPQGFQVSGVVSVDNELTSLYLVDSAGIHPLFVNPTPVVDNAPGGSSAAYGFQRVFSASGVDGLYDPFTLVAVLHNDYPVSAGPDPITGINESPDNPDNPFGFILAGTVSTFGGGDGNPVPLPASAGIGFSMLGGFGALFAFRKRLSRRPRIA